MTSRRDFRKAGSAPSMSAKSMRSRVISTKPICGLRAPTMTGSFCFSCFPATSSCRRLFGIRRNTRRCSTARCFAIGGARMTNWQATSPPGDARARSKKETNMSELRYPNENREYRDARDALLQDERELVEKVKAVAAKRRNLPPGGALKEDYLFQWANEGKVG